MPKRIRSKIWEDQLAYSDSFSELADQLITTDMPIKVENFDDFVQNIFSLSYPQYNFNTWHIRKLSHMVDEAIISDNHYLLAVLPRYHLKSSICGYASSLYTMLISRGEGLYISYKDELADIHLFHIKESVRNNPELSKVMQDLSSQSDSIVNYKIGNKRCKFYGSGIFGVKRGLHCDTLVVCLTPETEVFVSGNPNLNFGGGYFPISQVKVGDSVRTHLNRSREVIRIFQREINEEIVSLSLDNGEIIKITKNHKVMTNLGWKIAGDLSTKDVLMKLKFFESSNKGKHYEEIYGEKKAARLKGIRFKNVDRKKISYPTKGKTIVEYYGFEKAQEMSKKMSESLRGKNLKERVLWQCINCGKIEYLTMGRAKRRNFCSAKCVGKFYGEGMGFHFRAKKGNFRGKNNPNWKGGGVYPEVFSKSLKNEIFRRDEYVCQLCNRRGGLLNCHHVDYNKNNCSDTNLITLCRECNFKVNNKRSFWESYFKRKRIEKTGIISNGTKILEIKHELYCGIVYNLEVEEDNSYIGRGIIYHNCDDLMGDVMNPMNPTDIEKAKKLFDAEVMNIPNKACPLFVFGTVISDDDLLFHLKDKPAFQERMMWLPALYPDGEHEVLWESMYNKAWLEEKKINSGWKAFSTEFLLVPLLSTEAMITRDELDKVIDKGLKNYSIYQPFEKGGRHVVAGFDVGKKRNPSHLSVFVDNDEEDLTMIHQSFWDEMDYTKQIERLVTAIERFKIDKLYWDATRGELEDRSLPTRQCIPIKFTARGDHNQDWFAVGFAKRVENKNIKLLDDDRFISQITCLNNSLKAPDTPRGHADSFWSCALAVGAYQDYYSKDRKKGTSYLGDLQETLSGEKKVVGEVKEIVQMGISRLPDNICKICKGRRFESLDDGKKRCLNCSTIW